MTTGNEGELSDIVLQTERLVLRKMVEADVALLMELWRDPAVTRHVGGPRLANTLEDDLRESLTLDDPFDLFVLTERGSETPIGHVGILEKTIDGATEHELIYVLARAAWGGGYGKEIGAALVDHARNTLGLTRLVALIAPENEVSRAAAQKLGFSFERSVVRLDGSTKQLYSRTL